MKRFWHRYVFKCNSNQIETLDSYFCKVCGHRNESDKWTYDRSNSKEGLKAECEECSEPWNLQVEKTHILYIKCSERKVLT